MNTPSATYVALLHDGMKDKHGTEVTTSLTLIDVHDIARSCRTYDVGKFFIVHSAPAMRSFARTLKQHWIEGYGATYNPDRREALERLEVLPAFEEVYHHIELEHRVRPLTVATSALPGGERVSFDELWNVQHAPDAPPVLLLFGTGWGMSDALIAQADYFLEPIRGPGNYNHLSVRSAVAIILDRLFAGRY